MLGSVSFSLLFAKAKGIDLRTVGSGNLGATNVGRALGRRLGLTVYFLDMAKGFVPAFLGLWLDGPEAGVAGGVGAYLGHIWPLWLRFRGGKGVATLSGAMLALQPLGFVLAGLSWLLSVKLTGIVAIGSLVFGIMLPVSAWILDYPDPVKYFALGGGLFLFFTHRVNLQRLFSGRNRKNG
jgi:acyl phosphate:glycerol-3-phosphate acyltransferase